MTTIVKKCNCNHVFQDVKYGQGLRLHNQTDQGKKESERGWRCTVCGKES